MLTQVFVAFGCLCFQYIAEVFNYLIIFRFMRLYILDNDVISLKKFVHIYSHFYVVSSTDVVFKIVVVFQKLSFSKFILMSFRYGTFYALMMLVMICYDFIIRKLLSPLWHFNYAMSFFFHILSFTKMLLFFMICGMSQKILSLHNICSYIFTLLCRFFNWCRC